jgi:zinc transport system substrate-binding protein
VACGDDGGSHDADVVEVVASFYPLQYVAERVGGNRVRVTNLTPVGAEPHDVELSAADVARMADADLVVYLAGFSPAVDEAVAEAGEDIALETGEVAGLDLTYTPIEDGTRNDDEAGTDPHYWLDPTKLIAVADAVAERLGDLRPDMSDLFVEAAENLEADLVALDLAYRDGLATCRSRELVTGHNAFGYLAARYGLTQVGITGLTPDEEPSPADLAEIARFVEANDVAVIYAETLVSTDVADTIAAETGASVAVLDPLEGLAEGGGGDYLAIMRTNLATLRQGQGCT